MVLWLTENKKRFGTEFLQENQGRLTHSSLRSMFNLHQLQLSNIK